MTFDSAKSFTFGNQRDSSIFRWLHSTHATGRTVAIVFLANNFLTGFLFADSDLVQNPAIPIHLNDLLVGLSGAVILLIQNPLMRKMANGAFRFRDVFRAWLIASIAAIAIPLGIERYVSGEPLKPARIAGIPYGLESYMAQFAAFTILVAGISEMRRASTNLAQARHKLQEIQRNLNSQLRDQRSEMAMRANAQIIPVLDEIHAAISELSVSTPGLPAQAIPQLKSAIEDVVRPISHELALASDTPIDIEQHTVKSVSELRREISRMSLKARWLSKISIGSTFEPVLGALVFLMFVLPSIGYLDSIQSALFVCIPTIVAVSITSLGLQKLLSGIELPYLVVNLIGVTLNGAMTLYFVAATLVFPNELSPEIVLAFSFGTGAFLTISGYFGLVIARRFHFLELANDTNEQIGNSLSRLRHELLITQRQLGRLIHGGIQARLQSAILRLARASKLDDTLLAEVIADIEAARTELEQVEAPVSRTLGELLDDVIDFWNGICDVNVTITKELDELVSSDQIAVQCTIEVIREAVANSIKHDQAREASINVTMGFNDLIQILVSHQETSSQVIKVNSGLGSQIYSELSNHWTLTRSDEIVEFHAEVAFSR